MVAITIDGVKCHQNSRAFDPTRPVVRDSDGAQAYPGVRPLVWWRDCGSLPDGLSTYRTVRNANSSVVSVVDPIGGYTGPVAALAVAIGAFAYVVRTK
jgi:hypothetical protein